VLDGLESVSICLGYDINEDGAETPVYEELPGWQESTVGAKSLEELPVEARSYLSRIESACEVAIDFVSTGPDREETIVTRNPFGD